jgi:hypothetical protein
MANVAYSTQVAYLQLLLTGQLWPGIAQVPDIGPTTDFYLSLYNAWPGQGGNQTTNETAYSNYTRMLVPRSIDGFSVDATPPVTGLLAEEITFPQCGVSGDTLLFWGLGLSASGYGQLLMAGPLGGGPSLFTATEASPGVLTSPNVSPSVNAQVACFSTGFSTLPGGVTEGVPYYVGTVSGAQITLSTTPNNENPVTTSSIGAGFLMQLAPLVVSNGVTPQFAPNSLVILP